MDHCRVDKSLRARAQPLVVLAHPPVLSQPGERALYYPPPRQGHLPSRRHEPLPIEFPALLGPFPGPDLRHLLLHGLWGLAHDLHAQAHNLLGPPRMPPAFVAEPASSHRCCRRESPVRADSSRSLSPSWSGTFALCTLALSTKASVSTSRCRFRPLIFLLPS